MASRSQIKRRSKRLVSSARVDPTGTATLRRKFVSAVVAGYKKLKHLVLQQIGHDALIANESWVAESNPRKLERFRGWLRAQTGSTLAGDKLLLRYTTLAFQKGERSSFRPRIQRTPEFMLGMQAEYDRAAEATTLNAVKMLASRTFAEIEEVNSRMAARMSRALATGLMAGEDAASIAEKMAEETKLGASEAARIVRTELVRAYAEGQLTGFEKFGVENVKLLAEFSTVDDGKVCAKCKAMDGAVMDVKAARGVIPLHPECRCAWRATTDEVTANTWDESKHPRDHGRFAKKEYTTSRFGHEIDQKRLHGSFEVRHDPASGWYVYDHLTESIVARGMRDEWEATKAAKQSAKDADTEAYSISEGALDATKAVFAAESDPNAMFYARQAVKYARLKNYVGAERAHLNAADRLAELELGDARAAHLIAADYYKELTGNEDNCGTGAGGFKAGNTCGQKYAGERVGKEEHLHSERVEKLVAKHLGGTIVLRVRGKQQATDVERGDDGFEVKSLLKGEADVISVHPDAMLRKVRWENGEEGRVFHTVVVDERATYDDGAFAHKYSGHRLYYRRGSGRYALSTMHQVQSWKELRELSELPYDALPNKAKGSLPSGEALMRLQEQAETAHESRLRKDRARKARLRDERERAD